MAQGIGSAKIVVKMLLFCILVFHSHMIYANTYIVGDDGWHFGVVNWPNGKIFYAGETLVFNYPVGAHNVKAVDQGGYETCTSPPGSTVYTSGHDQIELAPGWNYFICGFPGHCAAGMRIAIYAIC